MIYARMLGLLLVAGALFAPMPGGAMVSGFQTEDLQADARRARAQGVPILLLFSADYCTYCDRLMEEFLEPMRRSGEYDDRVLIREVKIDDYGSMTDFDGARVNPEDLAYRYDISVVPTLLLLDTDGRELTKRIVGLGTVEFFGLYLDDAISRSVAKLKNP